MGQSPYSLWKAVARLYIPHFRLFQNISSGCCQDIFLSKNNIFSEAINFDSFKIGTYFSEIIIKERPSRERVC